MSMRYAVARPNLGLVNDFGLMELMAVLILVVLFVYVSDLTDLSHVATILFGKIWAFAQEMLHVAAASLFAEWTCLCTGRPPWSRKWRWLTP